MGGHGVRATAQFLLWPVPRLASVLPTLTALLAPCSPQQFCATLLTATLLRPQRVSEAMGAIWSSLVDDTRAAREIRVKCLVAGRQSLRLSSFFWMRAKISFFSQVLFF